jgi:hypothetical protein
MIDSAEDVKTVLHGVSKHLQASHLLTKRYRPKDESSCHLFSTVICNAFLYDHIVAYSPGIKFKNWGNAVQAARVGHLYVLQQRGPFLQYNAYVFTEACANGHLPIVQWCHQTNHPSCARSKDAMDYASRAGHLHILRYLHAHRKEGCTRYAMEWAALRGNLQVVKWLHENRPEYRPFADANRNRKKSRLHNQRREYRNRREHEQNWNERSPMNAMDDAAFAGHLHVVQWLHENRWEGCSTDAMDKAASNNHLHVVQWLHIHRTEGCTKNAMDMAAKNGHLDMVKWLHKNRKEGATVRAMDFAVQSGHFDILVWLHHNRAEGCSTDAMESAARQGNVKIFQWLHVYCHEVFLQFMHGVSEAYRCVSRSTSTILHNTFFM